MSKVTKLIKHPISFFVDMQKNKQKIVRKAGNSVIKVKTPPRELAISASRPIFGNIQFHDDVAIYFDGKLGNYYQLEQWFAPLTELSKVRKIVFVLREKEIFDRIIDETSFPAVHCNSIDHLMQVYEQSNFKCIVYVNHAARNFQSLIHGKALHIHINHGESDKLSTITNQSKSYDFVYLVGDAAYDKYQLNLLNKDMSKYIKIGRPQIEHIARIQSPSDTRLMSVNDANQATLLTKDGTDIRTSLSKVQDATATESTSRSVNSIGSIVSKRRKVVLYAPTWEGTHESMNYSSLSAFGLAIVTQILAHSDYYLIYKPHPNTGSRDKGLSSINQQIKKLLNNNLKGESVLSGDINSLYEHIDIAIFDNSAVAIDYLASNKPMLMSDLFGFDGNRQDKPIIVNAARMLKQNDISSLMPIIAEEILKDNRKKERQIVKRYFLGDFDYEKKESTKRFVDEIERACRFRDELAEKLSTQVDLHVPPI